MKVDFNKLRTFITVAGEGSVTQAASKLHLTQQAVSHQISALEKDLGMTLFIRANRRIFLTPEGHQVLAQSQQSLLSVEDRLLAMKEETQSLEGRVVVGATNEIAHTFIAPLIIAFKKLHPKVFFDIALDVDKNTEEKIIKGHIDIGFLIFTSYENQLQCRPIAKVPYVAVASKAFLRKHGEVESIKQVTELPFVDFLPSCPSFLTWIKINDKTLVSSALTRQPEVTAADERFIKDMIIKGIGFGVIPHYLVEEELKKKSLIELLPKSKKANAQIDLVFTKKREAPLLVDKFVEFALENS